MWFVALQPCPGQPCDCFEHLLAITSSTWAEPLRKKNGAHVVKRGIRIMLLLLGIPPKLIFLSLKQEKLGRKLLGVCLLREPACQHLRRIWTRASRKYP